MSGCVICGAPLPPRRLGHNGGGRPRVLCGAADCKRIRNRIQKGYEREARPYGRLTREHLTALKTLRQAAARRDLKLRAKAERGTYSVQLYAGRVWLTGAKGEPLEAIAAVKAWLYANEPAEQRPRQVERLVVVQDFRTTPRMSAADYAWGAA